MLVLPNGENIPANALATRIKQLDASIRSVKLYVRDNVLTADIYSAAPLAWDSLIGEFNLTLPRYERIQRFHIIDPSVLLK